MVRKQKIEIELNANDKASKKMDRLEKRTKKLSKSMKALGAAAAIGAVAIVGITAKLVKMAAEEEAVTAITKTLIENQGRSWDKLGAATDRYLKKLELLTTFNDTDLQIAFNELIGVGLDYENALETMTAVTDLAAAKQIDLRTAAQLVGKAFVGQTGSLSRYGIVLQEGLEEGEKFDAVLKLIANTMGGTATAQAGTLEGQMRNLKNQLSNVAEAIGAELIPKITPLVRQFADSLPAALETARGFVVDNRETLDAFGDVLSETGDLVVNVSGFFTGFSKDVDGTTTSIGILTSSLQLFADILGAINDSLVITDRFLTAVFGQFGGPGLLPPTPFPVFGEGLPGGPSAPVPTLPPPGISGAISPGAIAARLAETGFVLEQRSFVEPGPGAFAAFQAETGRGVEVRSKDIVAGLTAVQTAIEENPTNVFDVTVNVTVNRGGGGGGETDDDISGQVEQGVIDALDSATAG